MFFAYTLAPCILLNVIHKGMPIEMQPSPLYKSVIYKNINYKYTINLLYVSEKLEFYLPLFGNSFWIQILWCKFAWVQWITFGVKHLVTNSVGFLYLLFLHIVLIIIFYDQVCWNGNWFFRWFISAAYLKVAYTLSLVMDIASLSEDLGKFVN